MPVIINDFEVMVDPPQPPQASSETQAAPAPSALTPEDIERILAYFEERRARLRAD